MVRPARRRRERDNRRNSTEITDPAFGSYLLGLRGRELAIPLPDIPSRRVSGMTDAAKLALGAKRLQLTARLRAPLT